MWRKKPKKINTEPTVIKASVVRVEKPVEEPKPKKRKPLSVKLKSSLWKRAEELLISIKSNPVVNQNYPLMIGIAKTLQQQYPDIPHRVINTALYIHTHSELYLRNLSLGIGRFNLDGSFVEAIDEAGIEKAKELLSKMYERTHHAKRTPSHRKPKQNSVCQRKRADNMV